jgi:hypothetical protein
MKYPMEGYSWLSLRRHKISYKYVYESADEFLTLSCFVFLISHKGIHLIEYAPFVLELQIKHMRKIRIKFHQVQQCF